VAALVTVSVMDSWHVISINQVAFAAPDRVSTNAKVWWQALATLGNGDFFGQPITFSTLLFLTCALLTVGFVLYIPRFAWRHVPQLRASADGRMIAYVLFWSTSPIFISMAFIFSSSTVDLYQRRYLVGLVYAAAALVPLLALRRHAWRAVVVVCVFVFGLAGVIGLQNGTLINAASSVPNQAVADHVADVAAREGLDRGYAGYGDAPLITWATKFRVRVYPVGPCAANTHLCPFTQHTISSWYQARSAKRSFLLVDPLQPFLKAPTPDLGRPVTVHQINQLTMYVYPYDIASRIHF
jgi:hypothetical protein